MSLTDDSRHGAGAALPGPSTDPGPGSAATDAQAIYQLGEARLRERRERMRRVDDVDTRTVVEELTELHRSELLTAYQRGYMDAIRAFAKVVKN